MQPSVYEYREDDDNYMHALEDEHEAQRFIFCSRAYMFDAVSDTRRKPSVDLDLPSAMPARFRDAAMSRHAREQRLQQISDGGNATGEPTERPVVSLLLPSAALHGVVGAQPASAAGAETDLMQVQCQVLNASRFPTAA